MRVESELRLDFDDVLIRPKRSVAPSRASVDLKREHRFGAPVPQAGWIGIPIIAANLDTTGTMRMATALHELNMLTCLHKYYPLEELVRFFSESPARTSTFYTLGIRDEDFDKLKAFVKRVPDKAGLICIDAANGYTKFFVDRVKHVRELCPKATIMAGNVATPEMVQELLIGGGADIVKVGIGPGSVCTTQENRPAWDTRNCRRSSNAPGCRLHGNKGHIAARMAGCRTPGDIAKAFGAGADFVMLGGMLAGTEECEGEWTTDNGKKRSLKFYGMSSLEAQEKYHEGLKDYATAEGKCVEVPWKAACT